MKNIYAFLAIVALGFCSINSFAQTNTPERNNAGYLKPDYNTRATAQTEQKKIKSFHKEMTKEADFTLYSFPGKGTNYVTVKNVIPNTPVKVVAYDVTGRLIFAQDYLSNSFGQLVANIDPMVSFTPGTAFVAALYNNQAYYETMALNK